MKVLVLGVNSFNSKAGKPCFQAYVSMPNGNGSGFSPSITVWCEPLEFQALEKCAPCIATAEQSIQVNRTGQTEVRLQNFREMQSIFQAEKPSATAKAS